MRGTRSDRRRRRRCAGAFHRPGDVVARDSRSRLRIRISTAPSHTENAATMPPGPPRSARTGRTRRRAHVVAATAGAERAGRDDPQLRGQERPDGRRRPKLCAATPKAAFTRDREGADASADIASERAASPGAAQVRKTCTTSAIARIPTKALAQAGSEAGILWLRCPEWLPSRRSAKSLSRRRPRSARQPSERRSARLRAAASRQSASVTKRCASSTPRASSPSARDVSARRSAARRWRSTGTTRARTRSSTPSSKRSSRGSPSSPRTPATGIDAFRKLAHALPAPRARAPERISLLATRRFATEGTWRFLEGAVRARAARRPRRSPDRALLPRREQLLQRSRASTSSPV